MNNEKVYILEDRSILYVSGDDCYEFLQNLVSNDLSKVKDDNSCFASLLSPQGKFLFVTGGDYDKRKISCESLKEVLVKRLQNHIAKNLELKILN